MIIKGKSRARPKELARHLLNAKTNEEIRILANDYGLDYDLYETLSDWQALSQLTQGKLGLYHANIDPDARYEMTDEQFIESVDVLEKELGFEGQARFIVLHKKHDRTHAHVVWSRFDEKTRTLKSDSNNYMKHEAASLECERRFGHEHVPGVHVKKDRSQQRPVAAFDHAAWQQGERTGIDPRERQQRITDLYRRCDNGQAFVAALEADGYVLAKGKKATKGSQGKKQSDRAFVIVNRAGEIFSLPKQIKPEGNRSLTGKALKQYLSHLDFERDLPDAGQVSAEMKARRAEQQKSQASDHAQQLPAPASAVPAPAEAFNQQARPSDKPGTVFNQAAQAPEASALPEPAEAFNQQARPSDKPGAVFNEAAQAPEACASPDEKTSPSPAVSNEADQVIDARDARKEETPRAQEAPAQESEHWDREQYHRDWEAQLIDSAIDRADALLKRSADQNETEIDTHWDREAYHQAWEADLIDGAIRETERIDTALRESVPMQRADRRVAREEKNLARLDSRAQFLQKRQQGFERMFGQVYRDGDKAYARFYALESRQGFRAAIDTLRDKPQRLGRLLGRQFIVADGPRKAALKAVLDLADNGIRLQGLRKRVRQEKRERGAARQGVENARQWRETIRAHELSKITAPDQAAAAQTATIRTSSPTAERPSSLRTQSAPSPGLAKPVTHDHASVPAISESEQTRSRGQAPVREVPPAQESSLADTLRQRLESRRQGPLDERFNESADAQRQAKAERKRERAERKQREYLKRQAEYARDNRGHDREHSR